MVIINKYNDYYNKEGNKEVSKYDIFKDVFNFVKDFSKKYKLNFNFNWLLQSEENSLKDLRRICDSILEEIYDISFLSGKIQMKLKTMRNLKKKMKRK